MLFIGIQMEDQVWSPAIYTYVDKIKSKITLIVIEYVDMYISMYIYLYVYIEIYSF